MRKTTFISALLCFVALCAKAADVASVTSPDGKLQVIVSLDEGKAAYSVSLNGKEALKKSLLGFVANFADYSQHLSLTGTKTEQVTKSYDMSRSKFSMVNYRANALKVGFKNENGYEMSVLFQVSDNNVAFCYAIERAGDTGCIRIMKETTGFAFPKTTTTFLCPQSKAMIGWKRSKPSYEEVYQADAPLTEQSANGEGYTFPCLFNVNNGLWVLLSETGVNGSYCASHLSDYNNGAYHIAFPMPEENNGNGNVEPAFALPKTTPWRTITVGEGLKPIVETTVMHDVVEPQYTTTHDYKYGKSTWSWIVWQDDPTTYDNQVAFINLAKSMGYKYILIDAGWDKNIGIEKMEKLIAYAHSQGVDVFLWFSSSGYWNDIIQSPINAMDSPIERKKWMRWLQKNDVKGIKVDFFGGDKQETMRLYEGILSDAEDYGLMVIFHGCTIPRGWERMYPNYVGSEAVLASENMVFAQYYCDNEAFNACLHPFIRNAIGSMEWGGSFLNRNLRQGNKGGSKRISTDCLELATSILYQNAIQNFAVTPENLLPLSEGGAPEISVDFMKNVPTTWDETRFIEGYPGKYVILARRNGNTWYIAGVNAEKEQKTVTLDLSAFMGNGDKVKLYKDNLRDQDPVLVSQYKVRDNKKVKITMSSSGGFVIVK